MNDSIQQKKQVILVDDDKVEEIILRKYLEKSNVDIALRVFYSGEQFINYMQSIKTDQSAQPNMVLLDIRMWGIDGFSVLKTLRDDPHFKSYPAISVFSNSQDPSDREKSLTLGANNYYCKPRNGDEYINFLHSLDAVI